MIFEEPSKWFDQHSMSEYLSKIADLFGKPDLQELQMPVIAIDDGYAVMKASWLGWDDDGNPTIVRFSMPSRAQKGKALMALAGGTNSLYGSEEDDIFYTVSPYVPVPEDTRNEKYAHRPINRFLIHAVLERIGLKGKPVVVITGLPLEQYLDGEDGFNTRHIQRKTDNIKKPVYCGMQKEPSALIVHHACYAEALGGMMNFLIDLNGQEQVEAGIRMVFDIGGNTTDLAIVMPDGSVSKIKTIYQGVSHIRDQLKISLSIRFEVTPDELMLDMALREGKVAPFGGPEEDVTAEVEMACQPIVKEIIATANEFKDSYPSLTEYVGIGGGSAVLQQYIQREYTATHIPENPGHANADGFLKMAIVFHLAHILEQAKQLVDPAPVAQEA